jgi:hypothetical protein
VIQPSDLILEMRSKRRQASDEDSAENQEASDKEKLVGGASWE